MATTALRLESVAGVKWSPELLWAGLFDASNDRVLVVQERVAGFGFGSALAGRYEAEPKDLPRPAGCAMGGYDVLGSAGGLRLAILREDGAARPTVVERGADGSWRNAQANQVAALERIVVANPGAQSGRWPETEMPFYGGPVVLSDGNGKRLASIALPQGFVATGLRSRCAARRGEAVRSCLRIVERAKPLSSGTGEEIPATGLLLTESSEAAGATGGTVVVLPSDARLRRTLPEGGALSLTDACWLGDSLAKGLLVRGVYTGKAAGEALEAVLIWCLRGEQASIVALQGSYWSYAQDRAYAYWLGPDGVVAETPVSAGTGSQASWLLVPNPGRDGQWYVAAPDGVWRLSL